MRSTKVLGSFKTSVTNLFSDLFGQFWGSSDRFLGLETVFFSSNGCMHTLHWIVISS